MHVGQPAADADGGCRQRSEPTRSIEAGDTADTVIAERMYLAKKTVKNYVSNMLAKLDMRHRTQAAIYAARLADRRTRPPQ